MDSIVKRLIKLQTLFKAIKQQNSAFKLPSIPTIKPPSQPSMTPPSTYTKISSGQGPDSKKDPRKMAQQIKDGSMSTKTQKAMLKNEEIIDIADNGQWSLHKAEQDFQLYHIHQNGQQITDTPISIKQIIARHGSVQRLENAGYRLIPHKPKK